MGQMPGCLPSQALDLASDEDMDSSSFLYDIFLIYNAKDSPLARSSTGFSEELPSYGDLIVAASDPRVLKAKLSQRGLKIWCDFENPDIAGSYTKQSEIMKRSKIIVACVSNAFAMNPDNRMQIQFARKTLQKPIIPLVVESFEKGPPWKWQTTAIGLLLAGELYVDFTDTSKEDQKLDELKSMVDNQVSSVGSDSTVVSKQASVATTDEKAADVFISYCWSNSHNALRLNQVKEVSGRAASDPRDFAEALKSRGLHVWLDIWRLQSGGQLFEQIANGLLSAAAVVVFVSDEYARSDNCRMEIQFAARSLRKPIIPVICGAGNAWSDSVVGMLVLSLQCKVFDMRSTGDQAGLLSHVSTMLQRIKSGLPMDDSDAPPAYSVGLRADSQPRKFHAPQKGDKVMGYHLPTTCFYACTISSFDKAKMEYTVNWDDGDPSGRTMPFDKVALNVTPNAEDIAVGSKVIFPQGQYVGGDSNTGGMRYHEGVITRIYAGTDGKTRYNGKHTLPYEDRKMKYRAYEENFTGYALEDLRMSPNAIDAVMAFAGSP